MRRPIRRLMANRVFSGLVTACRLAAWPTRRSPDSVKATIEGVVRAPSAFSITLASLPSITATQELVVPRSIPITLVIVILSIGGPARPSCEAPDGPPGLGRRQAKPAANRLNGHDSSPGYIGMRG